MEFFFSISGALSTCEEQRRKFSQYSAEYKSRQFVPTCDEDGKFMEIQCWSKVNQCWCVDDNGLEIASTRLVAKKPDCKECMYFMFIE